MDVVSLRFSWCAVGWQRSGHEGWPSCMIKSRRGGRERPKGGRESDFPIHSLVVSVCPPKLPSLVLSSAHRHYNYTASVLYPP